MSKPAVSSLNESSIESTFVEEDEDEDLEMRREAHGSENVAFSEVN